MWNHLKLLCPSSDMVDYQPHEMCFVEELRDIITILTTAADILTSDNSLWEEMNILCKIQIKYKRMLRCDKSLIYLHRVSHCLKKMVLLNLSKSYLDLAERFLIGFSSQGPFITTVRLPSRQQIEYILIRTLSAAKLICDCMKYSRETFCYLLQKIKVGHTLLDLITAGSVTARLIVLLKGILEQICDMYKQVLTFQFKSKKGTYQWSEKLDLPQDLKKWLETSNSAVFKPIPMSQNDVEILSSLLKTKDKNKDSDTESVVVVNEVNNNDKNVPKQIQNGNVTDYGEVIPRKKRKRASNLTIEQKALLLKIIRVRNLEELEDMWNDLNSFSGDYLPKTLSDGNKAVIAQLFLRIRSRLSKKNSNKKSKESMFLKNALSVFSKRLGFTPDEIEMCLNEVRLEPVKTLKELKVLYEELCKILKFSNELSKYYKLQRIFKRRKTDIRLLKESGEKSTAKQLIFCTSKVLLTIYQK